jgi:hypothetical protein
MTIKGNRHRGKTKFEVSKPPRRQALHLLEARHAGLRNSVCPHRRKMSRRAGGPARRSNTISAPIAAAAPIRSRRTGRPASRISTIPKVGINARLVDDFDLGSVPVTVIEGKNLW